LVVAIGAHKVEWRCRRLRGWARGSSAATIEAAAQTGQVVAVVRRAPIQAWRRDAEVGHLRGGVCYEVGFVSSTNACFELWTLPFRTATPAAGLLVYLGGNLGGIISGLARNPPSLKPNPCARRRPGPIGRAMAGRARVPVSVVSELSLRGPELGDDYLFERSV